MQGTTSRRTREGILVISGAAVILAVLLILQLIIGSGLLSTKTVTVTAPDAYEQVANAYANHLMQFSTKDRNALVSAYESNATVEWTGSVAGFAGTYVGTEDIGILLASFTGKFVNFSLSNNYQSVGVKDNVSVVNSTFNFQGYSSIVGRVNGTVVAHDVYEHVGPSWLIARERWNFTQFNNQFPPFT